MSLLALLSSLLWGTSDFLGGRLSRRAASIWVVTASQVCSFGVLAVAAGGAFALGMRPHGAGWLGWGAAGGVALTVALVSFYRALAAGRMGVIAPIAATGVAVPVAVGLAQGDRPAAVQVIGVVLAVIGVVVASRPPAEPDGATEGGAGPVALALLAGVGFGGGLVFLHAGARSNGLDTLLVMRVVLVALLIRPAWRARPATVDSATWRTVVLVGLCDVGANGAFALASVTGALALVAVLSSLYPVVTTVLARQLLHERLSHSQVAGVVATIAGSVLIVV